MDDKIQQLIEFTTSDVIAKIVETEGKDMNRAMNEFITSEFYLKLTDSQTGLYLEGSDYIYELYKRS